MYDQFTDTQEFPSVLTVNGKEQGACDVRLIYNPYDTNNMEVEIFEAPDLDIPDLPSDPSFADYARLDARLVLQEEGLSRSVKIRSDALASLSFPNFSYSLSDTLPVEEYKVVRRWDTDSPHTDISVSYHFPLTTAVIDRSMATRDARYGFYRGQRDPNQDTVQLDKDTFTVETQLGNVEFGEAYGTHEIDSKHTYPAITLIRRSECHLNLSCQNRDGKQAIQQARKTISTLLSLLSLAEQNRINWNVETVHLKSKKGDSIERHKTYRWAPPTSDQYRPTGSSLRNVRASFTSICEAYQSLNSSMIREIDRAVENFKRANCAGVLEKKLVFWHSCLDHLTENLYGFGNGPFSKRLIDACERGGIELDDLLDPKVVRHFQNDLDDDHNCFWFVDARNRFVHDGLDALDNEYYQLTDAIQKARALAERLLLNKVGIDYRDLNEGSRHCLGFPSRRQ